MWRLHRCGARSATRTRRGRHGNRVELPSASHTCRGARETPERALGAVASVGAEVITSYEVAQLSLEAVELPLTDGLAIARGGLGRLCEHPVRVGDLAIQASDELSLLLGGVQFCSPHL